jgi:hypothetical protein
VRGLRGCDHRPYCDHDRKIFSHPHDDNLPFKSLLQDERTDVNASGVVGANGLEPLTLSV